MARVVGPMACGTEGCPLLMFREVSGGCLQVITQGSLVKDPLVVSETRRNGWRDLRSRLRVDAANGYDALLSFGGRIHPSNPSVPPARVTHHISQDALRVEY